MNTFNDRVKELAELRGWSQNELARRSGLSVGLINAIFKGEKTLDNISYNSIKTLASTLGVHARYLLEEEGELASPTDILLQLPDDIRNFILDFKVSLPWLDLAKNADAKRIHPKDLQIIIDTISRKMSE